MSEPEIENTEPRTMLELLQQTSAVAFVAADELGQLAEAWESAATIDTDEVSVALGAACALFVTLADGADKLEGRECLRQGAAAVHIAAIAAVHASKCFERLAELAADPTTEAGKAAAAALPEGVVPCSECQQRHPLSFRFNGRLRGWHEQLAERRSETGKRNIAKRVRA